MAERKLSKSQKEILEMMRDKGAEIIFGTNARYKLWIGNDKIKTIPSETFYFLRAWFVQTKRDFYTFKPDAEISDAWRTQEIERQREEAQRKREEDTRLKEQTERELMARVREAFAAIECGEIDNASVEYGYRIRFEYGGKWYNLAEE